MWVAVVAALLSLAVAAVLVWAATPLGPSTSALAALRSDDTVAVRRTDAGYEFSPIGQSPDSALVFYPGGRVDARSYAPFARDIAANGHLVVVPAMPLSLAVLDSDAADRAIEAHPEVRTWVVGGHSLGGAMAASYARNRSKRLDGVLLVAAYATSGADLSDTRLAVTDITGTNDTVLDQETWAAGHALLPDDAVYVTVAGGNHAGFGDYGPQPGDGESSLVPAEQRRTTVRAALELLARAGR